MVTTRLVTVAVTRKSLPPLAPRPDCVRVLLAKPPAYDYKSGMRPALILAALTFPAIAVAGNYAECILDRSPGLQNDAAGYAAHKYCQERYPGGLQAVAQGSGRGLLGFDSGAECTLKKAADTPSRFAALNISSACDRLYDRPMRPMTADQLFEDLPRRNLFEDQPPKR